MKSPERARIALLSTVGGLILAAAAGCSSQLPADAAAPAAPAPFAWADGIGHEEPATATEATTPQVTRAAREEDGMFDPQWQRDAWFCAELAVASELQRGYVWHLRDQLEIVERAQAEFLDQAARNRSRSQDLTWHYRQLRGLEQRIEEKLAAAEAQLARMEASRQTPER